MKKLKKSHVCTRKCLRWTEAFGRRFYYCKLVKPTIVRVHTLRASKRT